MSCFNDLKGREHTLAPGFGVYAAIKAATGANFSASESFGQSYARLLHDDDFALAVIAAAVRAREPELAAAMNGETLEAAITAFGERGRGGLLRHGRDP